MATVIIVFAASLTGPTRSPSARRCASLSRTRCCWGPWGDPMNGFQNGAEGPKRGDLPLMTVRRLDPQGEDVAVNRKPPR